MPKKDFSVRIITHTMVSCDTPEQALAISREALISADHENLSFPGEVISFGLDDAAEVVEVIDPNA